jgi:hypothetical protein
MRLVPLVTTYERMAQRGSYGALHLSEIVSGIVVALSVSEQRNLDLEAHASVRPGVARSRALGLTAAQYSL